jgi:hypothetical protein
MSRYDRKPNNRVNQLFDDLEKYKAFCIEYGYRYDEADLYKDRSYVWRQYSKLLAGKPVKNQWDEMLKVTE